MRANNFKSINNNSSSTVGDNSSNGMTTTATTIISIRGKFLFGHKITFVYFLESLALPTRSTNYAATSLHHNKKVTSLQLVRSICGASMYTIVWGEMFHGSPAAQAKALLSCVDLFLCAGLWYLLIKFYSHHSVSPYLTTYLGTLFVVCNKSK